MKTIKNILLASGILLFIISCNRSNDRRTINYSESEPEEVTIDELLIDTSKVLMADYPFFFDSTRILIHPVGFVNVEEQRKSRLDMISSSRSKGYDKDQGFSIYAGNDVVRGSITYLMFEDVLNNVSHTLTDKVLNISTVTFLRDLYRKTGGQYLLYILQDKDTNNDKLIDGRDVTSLYISKLDGTSFLKLTADYHQFEGGVWKSWCLRYYFRTLEDVNRDGKFTKKDKYHYYYIDFGAKDIPYEVVEYNPLKGILD